jgi:hypothetical protein
VDSKELAKNKDLNNLFGQNNNFIYCKTKKQQVLLRSNLPGILRPVKIKKQLSKTQPL